MIASADFKTVEIVGGGLAGLGLGLGLRKAGVPVVVVEAGHYPRHRVCGEFITSLDSQTIDTLGLASVIQEALPARSVSWFDAKRRRHSHHLPEPALCLTRHKMDQKMAERFVETGGQLITEQKGSIKAVEGRVLTTGRRPQTRSSWLGIKAHFMGLSVDDDLELHLGDHAYVGITRVETDRLNVCGLFRRRAPSGARVSKQSVLTEQLKHAGLNSLAERLAKAELDEHSLCSVAGLDYGEDAPTEGAVHLGDQFGLIPPFTGNGMTIALQGARIAVDPLRAWSAGQCSWSSASREIHANIQKELVPRIRRARRLHPWLLNPGRQRILVGAAATRLLPTRLLYQLLH